MDTKDCYGIRFPGKPGFGVVMSDDPKHKAETAKSIARYIRQGGIVERVTADEARAGLSEFLGAIASGADGV